MENIIKCAIEGGWKISDGVYQEALMNPLFWQALGKSKGWGFCPLRHYPHSTDCDPVLKKALLFHGINLSMSFEKAVSWLEEQIK